MSPIDSFRKSVNFQSHSDSFPTKTHKLSHTHTYSLSVLYAFPREQFAEIILITYSLCRLKRVRHEFISTHG